MTQLRPDEVAQGAASADKTARTTPSARVTALGKNAYAAVATPTDAAVAGTTTPLFDALIAEAQQTKAADLISPEELDQRRPLTEEDQVLAAEYLAVFDRIEAEQEAEVTASQAHLLGLIQIATRVVRGERTLAEWADYSGFPEADLRAVAVALETAGL